MINGASAATEPTGLEATTHQCIAVDDTPQGSGSGDRLLSVIVPCFNESATLESILRALRRELPHAEIIVIDDGSTDRSLLIARSLQDELTLRVIAREHNGGKGAAVRDGVAIASRDFIAIQDADLEYDPRDLRSMILAATSSSEELKKAHYGSRYLNSGRSPRGSVAAYVATRILALVQWILYGHWMSDPVTCYKLLDASLFRRLHLESTGFELCAEMNAKLFRLGIPIVETPISYQPRTTAEGKKIGLRDFFRLIASLLRWRVARLETNETPAEPMSVPAHVIAMRIVIGTLLLVAGVSKIVAGQPMLLANAWLIAPTAVVAWAMFECVIGWLTLGFATGRWLWIILTSMFTAFACLLSIEWIRGASECQCLGGAGLPIVGMIVLDLMIVVHLIVFRRAWRHGATLPDGLLGDLAKQSRWVVPGILLMSVVLFGSPQSAIGFLSGNSVTARTSHRYAGEVHPDATATTTFELRNVSDRPIRVLGAKASCRCVAIDDLPLTLGPKETKAIRVQLVAGKVPGVQRESAELLFDDSTPNLTLGVTALVHPNP